MTKRRTKPTVTPVGKQPKRTHCKRGHRLAGNNLEITASGGHYCRICHRAAILEAKKLARLRHKPNREVGAGQIWRALHKPNRGQLIRILGIIGDYAIVKPLRRQKSSLPADRRLIKLNRFYPMWRGYKLVQE